MLSNKRSVRSIFSSRLRIFSLDFSLPWRLVNIRDRKEFWSFISKILRNSFSAMLCWCVAFPMALATASRVPQLMTFKLIREYSDKNTYVDGIMRKKMEPNIMLENSFGWMHEAKEKMRTIPSTNIEVGEKTVSSTIWLVVAIRTANMINA